MSDTPSFSFDGRPSSESPVSSSFGAALRPCTLRALLCATTSFASVLGMRGRRWGRNYRATRCSEVGSSQTV